MGQRGGKVRASHQELVDPVGGLTAFGDGPDDQALPARHVARSEDLGIFVLLDSFDSHVLGPVEIDAKLLEQTPFLRARRNPSQAGPGPPGKPSPCPVSRRTGTAVTCFHFDIDGLEARRHGPFSPRKRLVLIEYSRPPPSSWAEETRKTFDHCGHGFDGAVGHRAGAGRSRTDGRSCIRGGEPSPGSRPPCRRRR